VVLPILNYRDYRAFAGDGEELEIVNNEKMQIRVQLPAGFHDEVEVGFVSPLYWRISEVISLCTVIGLTVLGLWKCRGRRKRHEKA